MYVSCWRNVHILYIEHAIDIENKSTHLNRFEVKKING